MTTTTADRLTHVRACIAEAAQRAGRAPGEIELVAVAKTATPSTLQAAWDAGQRIFGHNRVQALEEHCRVLPEARWHLLGPLQGRKVRRGLALAQCFQALSDAKTLDRCRRALEEVHRLSFPVFLQVNLQPEDGRAGCHLQALDALVDAVRKAPQLQLSGLMTLAPQFAQGDALRRHFSLLYQHFSRLQESGQLPRDARLSMGMSQDYATAIEEGANLVRVGRAIFPPPQIT